MGDCCEIYGCRPDGQLCDQNFWDLCWKSFLFESHVRTVRHCCPDGRTSAASNIHIRLRASGPWGMAFRMVNLQHTISISNKRASGPWAASVQTVEVEYAISISVERASGPCWQTSRRVNLNCDDGNPRRPDGCNNLPIFELGKNLKLDRILRGVQTDASWNRSFSKQRSVRTEIHVVRTDDALVCRGSGRYDTSSERLEVWTDGHPDGMTRRSDDWQGTENLLTCNQYRVFWKYSE
jgi:hypothetical protein